MRLGLAGRTVVVTGASNGIGAAVATAFGAEGAHVVVGYHSGQERAAQVAEQVRSSGGQAWTQPYDLADAGSAERLVERAMTETGSLDVVVANAVRWWRRGPGGFEGLPLDDAEAVVSDNLLGAVRLARAVAPAMRRQDWGRVAFISSNLALDGLPGAEYYVAAKSGLHGLCRSLAWSLGPHGVLANVVVPGVTMTARNQANFPAPLRQMEVERTPSGRLVVPEDIADTVVFLCSEANRGISGELVKVTGGR